MSRRHRNPRRRRREPIRSTSQNACQHSIADADAPELGPATERLLLTESDPLAYEHYPPTLTPLFVMIAAVYQAIGGRLSYPHIVASGQLVRAFEYLGFEAELMPASTSMFRLTSQRTRIMEREVWGDPRILFKEGVFNEHLVVWVDSFKRFIDVGLCHDRTLVRAAARGDAHTLPAVLCVPGGRAQLISESMPMTVRRPFGIMWKVLPQSMPRFNSILASHSSAIEHGGLALAHVTVDLLAALAVYKNLNEINGMYRRLGDLVSGRFHLPELNDNLLHGNGYRL